MIFICCKLVRNYIDMNKYAFFGKMTTKAGKRDELMAILSQAAASMNDVKGCRLYIIHKDSQDENAICVYELWDSKEDHNASLKLTIVQELIGKAMPLLDGMPEGKQFEAVAGKGL